MKKIEIWAKAVEGGDAIGADRSVNFLRFTDPEDDIEVVVFLPPETLEQLKRTLDAGVFSNADAKPRH